MRKLMIATGAAALLVASSFAVMAEEATGRIASVDATAGTITLSSGEKFKLPTTVSTASLQVGQQVKVTYRQSVDGSMTATAIAPAQ